MDPERVKRMLAKLRADPALYAAVRAIPRTRRRGPEEEERYVQGLEYRPAHIGAPRHRSKSKSKLRRSKSRRKTSRGRGRGLGRRATRGKGRGRGRGQKGGRMFSNHNR